MLRLISSLALISPLAACSEPELPSNFHQSLTTHGSCAGYLYAGSPGGQHLLVFKPDEALGTIVGDGGTRTYDFTASPSGALMYAELGSDLVTGFCSTTGSGNTDARYHPISGSASFVVTGLQTGEYRGDLTLTNVLLRKEHASHEVTIPSLAVTNVDIP